MTLEHSRAPDNQHHVGPRADDSDRVAFTVKEFCARVFPMSRAAFYEDVKAGLIHILKRGKRSYVTIDEARAYPARLAARAADHRYEPTTNRQG